MKALFASALLALAALLPLPVQAQGFTPDQRREIVSILRDALRQDPSILRDALEAMELAEQEQRAGAARGAIERHREALTRNPADPVRGNAAGAITVVEFFDPRCPYCKRMIPALNELVRRNRDVRVVLKDLPILGPNSVLASKALLASQRQGRYHEYHDALLQTREDLTEPVLKREAEKLGLNWARLRADMDDAAIARQLEANLALSRQIGIEGTPAFIVGTRLVPGAMELPQLEQLVAAARAAR